MLELYRNIRKYRKEARMSQEELAKKVGYTDRSSIAKIENGDVDLPQSKIMAIAKALDVSAGALMGWESVSDETATAVLNLPMIAAQNQELHKYFDKLNDAGKQRAISLVKDLCDIPKYNSSFTGSNSEGIA